MVGSVLSLKVVVCSGSKLFTFHSILKNHYQAPVVIYAISNMITDSKIWRTIEIMH